MNTKKETDGRTNLRIHKHTIPDTVRHTQTQTLIVYIPIHKTDTHTHTHTYNQAIHHSGNFRRHELTT